MDWDLIKGESITHNIFLKPLRFRENFILLPVDSCMKPMWLFPLQLSSAELAKDEAASRTNQLENKLEHSLRYSDMTKERLGSKQQDVESVARTLVMDIHFYSSFIYWFIYLKMNYIFNGVANSKEQLT